MNKLTIDVPKDSVVFNLCNYLDSLTSEIGKSVKGIRIEIADDLVTLKTRGYKSTFVFDLFGTIRSAEENPIFLRNLLGWDTLFLSLLYTIINESKFYLPKLNSKRFILEYKLNETKATISG